VATATAHCCVVADNQSATGGVVVKYLKLLGLALVTACAMSVGFVASASAAVPVLLPEGVHKFEGGEGGKGTLEKASNGLKVECEHETGEAETEKGESGRDILGTFP